MENKNNKKIENVISVRDLRTQFGNLVIHDKLNLDIRKGEVLGIVGGSGTGKSVLLREILGLMHPTKGQIKVLGHDITKESPEELMPLRQKTGVLFQNGALFSALTVQQNIEIMLKANTKLDKELICNIAKVKIAMAGLPPEAAHKFPSELSGGMVKRAALARAIALDPEILFLDEPTAGLDPIGAAKFDTLIKQLQESLGLTVVMITHDLDSLIAITDRVAAIINKACIVDELDRLRQYDDPWIKEYFSGKRGRQVMSALDLMKLESTRARLERRHSRHDKELAERKKNRPKNTKDTKNHQRT